MCVCKISKIFFESQFENSFLWKADVSSFPFIDMTNIYDLNSIILYFLWYYPIFTMFLSVVCFLLLFFKFFWWLANLHFFSIGFHFTISFDIAVSPIFSYLGFTIYFVRFEWCPLTTTYYIYIVSKFIILYHFSLASLLI